MYMNYFSKLRLWNYCTRFCDYFVHLWKLQYTLCSIITYWYHFVSEVLVVIEEEEVHHIIQNTIRLMVGTLTKMTLKWMGMYHHIECKSRLQYLVSITILLMVRYCNELIIMSAHINTSVM